MLSFSIFNFLILLLILLLPLSLIFKNNLNSYLNFFAFNNLLFISISLLIFICIYINFYIYKIFESTFCYSTSLSDISISLNNIMFPFLFLLIIITLISLIFCLSYNNSEIFSFLVFITIILFSGISIFFVDSIFFFFFFYECLLIPSFIILYLYSKTRKSVEASYLMFFWTQFGALMLIFVFIYLFFTTNSYLFSSLENYNFTKFEVNFLFLLLLIGFGVKLPLWPFYDWLPKAHVEASTNFSIFLSGVLVKFAFFGFFKCLLVYRFWKYIHISYFLIY